MSAAQPASTFTWQGALIGARMMVPVLPGLAVYALAFGAASSDRGLTFAEATALSGIVFAGASQMVALEIWRDSWTPLALLTVALVTATVNARFLLMGASIQPWLRGLHPAKKAVGLFFMADATWLIATRYAEGGGRDHAVLFGAGILSWVVWVAATIPGYVAGSLVAEPRLYALDLVMPVFFASMAVPLWRGMGVSGAPWIVAAVVALAVQALVPGYGFIVAGALSGALTGALQRDPG